MQWPCFSNPRPQRRIRAFAQPPHAHGVTSQAIDQKAFDDISIQEIADEATLNRATFYLHYPDKRRCCRP